MPIIFDALAPVSECWGYRYLPVCLPVDPAFISSNTSQQCCSGDQGFNTQVLVGGMCSPVWTQPFVLWRRHFGCCEYSLGQQADVLAGHGSGASCWTHAVPFAQGLVPGSPCLPGPHSLGLSQAFESSLPLSFRQISILWVLP